MRINYAEQCLYIRGPNRSATEEERSALQSTRAETEQESFRIGIRRSNASEAAPGHCSYSVTYSLWDRKPVHGIPHVRRDCSIFRDMPSETGGITGGWRTRSKGPKAQGVGLHGLSSNDNLFYYQLFVKLEFGRIFQKGYFLTIENVYSWS